MKRIHLIIIILFLTCRVHAQDTTIISDSYIGIYRSFISDTFYIDKVVPNSPANIGGLKIGDKVIEINGMKVSGAGLGWREIDKHLGNAIMNILLIVPAI